MTIRKDPFRPNHEPARSLYDAFQNAAMRKPRDFDLEERAVWECARDYAQQNGLRVPMLSEVRDATICAQGHVDFGAKWVYAVSRLLECVDG